MIKGIYISNHNLNDKSSGVTKKIQMQLEAFKKNNILIVKTLGSGKKKKTKKN